MRWIVQYKSSSKTKETFHLVEQYLRSGIFTKSALAEYQLKYSLMVHGSAIKHPSF